MYVWGGGKGRGRAVRCEVIFDIIQRKHVRTCTYIYQLCILWYYILEYELVEEKYTSGSKTDISY